MRAGRSILCVRDNRKVRSYLQAISRKLHLPVSPRELQRQPPRCRLLADCGGAAFPLSDAIYLCLMCDQIAVIKVIAFQRCKSKISYVSEGFLAVVLVEHKRFLNLGRFRVALIDWVS